MRGDNDQIDIAFFCDAHNLRRCFAVNHQLLDIEARAFVAFGQFRQLALGGVFELLGDVGNRQRFSHPGITHRRNNGLDDVDANDRSFKPTRQRCRIGERVISTLAEVGREKYGANLHKRHNNAQRTPGRISVWPLVPCCGSILLPEPRV